jgi:hypothetical protein
MGDVRSLRHGGRSFEPRSVSQCSTGIPTRRRATNRPPEPRKAEPVDGNPAPAPAPAKQQGGGGGGGPVEIEAIIGEAVPLPTGVEHKIKVRQGKPRVRAVLRDDVGAIAKGCRYELKIGEQSFSGTTKDDGLIDHEYERGPKEGELKVWFKNEAGEEEEHTIELTLELAPLHSTEGIQARLNNLGFDCGPIDGDLGEDTRAAIEDFQIAMGFEEATGELDEDTRSALEKLSVEAAKPPPEGEGSEGEGQQS